MKHGSSTSKQKTKVHTQLMAWHLENSTWKKKYTAVTSSWKVHGFIRVAIVPTRTTVNSNACVAKLTKLRARFNQFEL
jgi:dihydroorotase